MNGFEEWVRLYHQKRRDLLSEKCINATGIRTKHDLQRSLISMSWRKRDRGGDLRIGKTLQNLDLERIDHFATAVSLASQHPLTANLIWGCVQACLEVRVNLRFDNDRDTNVDESKVRFSVSP